MTDYNDINNVLDQVHGIKNALSDLVEDHLTPPRGRWASLCWWLGSRRRNRAVRITVGGAAQWAREIDCQIDLLRQRRPSEG